MTARTIHIHDDLVTTLLTNMGMPLGVWNMRVVNPDRRICPGYFDCLAAFGKPKKIDLGQRLTIDIGERT